MKRRSFSLRRIFLAGLLTTMPTVVTAYVFWKLFSYFDGLLRPLVQRWLHRQLPGVGLLALVSLVLLIGLFAGNLVGARIVRAVSRRLERIPLFSPLYRTVRDISEVVLGDKASAFRRVALIEWPRRGLWSIVFLTSEFPGPADDRLGRSTLTVFVPTTPNPTTGFLHWVPREEVVFLDMSVEQALKVIISGGAAYGPGPGVVRPPAGGAAPEPELPDC